jgi:hypothetical protein
MPTVTRHWPERCIVFLTQSQIKFNHNAKNNCNARFASFRRLQPEKLSLVPSFPPPYAAKIWSATVTTLSTTIYMVNSPEPGANRRTVDCVFTPQSISSVLLLLPNLLIGRRSSSMQQFLHTSSHGDLSIHTEAEKLYRQSAGRMSGPSPS